MSDNESDAPAFSAEEINNSIMAWIARPEHNRLYNGRLYDEFDAFDDDGTEDNSDSSSVAFSEDWDYQLSEQLIAY